MLLPTHLIRVTVVQPTVALIRVTADIATTAALMYQYLRASTETGKPAQLVQINPPTPHTRVTAAQATVALIRVTQGTVSTVHRMYQYLRANLEMGKTVRLVPMRRQIPTIQAPGQPAATVPTAATAVTAIMVLLMSQYRQASTEAGKLAQLVPISLPTLHTQVTAAQATAARGLAMRLTILTEALVQPEISTVTKALPNPNLV